ncbi:RES family NAD+ phosphorylase [Streptomyces sp. R08]|uniref:RES family NAD+ phosphorylase n=1 Tax=Streptomyces sp. R08 TaxID=3238624 RepID=A0AB39M0U0_9ACTN
MTGRTKASNPERDAPTQEWYQGQNLAEFPQEHVHEEFKLFRAHSRDYGPIYYASYPPQDGGRGGRFDLPEGRSLGTCYMATSGLTALRERFGPRLINARILPRKLFEETSVSQVRLPHAYWTASLITGSEARFGVKASEMSSSVNYDISRTWALAWWAWGLDGVWYKPGWDPRLAVVSLALFAEQTENCYPTCEDTQPGEGYITQYEQEFKTRISAPISKDEATTGLDE